MWVIIREQNEKSQSFLFANIKIFALLYSSSSTYFFFWHKSLFSTKKVTKYYKNVFNTNFYVVWLKIDDIYEYCIKLSMKMTQMNFIYFVPSKFSRVSCCHYSNDYHVVVNFLLLSCGIVYIFHCHEKRHLLTKLFDVLITEIN